MEKKRVTLTLSDTCIDGIDRLVEAGIYMERQMVIRAALRLFLRDWRIPPFYPEAETSEA